MNKYVVRPLHIKGSDCEAVIVNNLRLQVSTHMGRDDALELANFWNTSDQLIPPTQSIMFKLVVELLIDRKFEFQVVNASMLNDDDALNGYVPDDYKDNQDLLMLYVQLGNQEQVIWDTDFDTLYELYKDLVEWDEIDASCIKVILEQPHNTDSNILRAANLRSKGKNI